MISHEGRDLLAREHNDAGLQASKRQPDSIRIHGIRRANETLDPPERTAVADFLDQTHHQINELLADRLLVYEYNGLQRIVDARTAVAGDTP